MQRLSVPYEPTVQYRGSSRGKRTSHRIYTYYVVESRVHLRELIISGPNYSACVATMAGRASLGPTVVVRSFSLKKYGVRCNLPSSASGMIYRMCRIETTVSMCAIPLLAAHSFVTAFLARCAS